MSKSKHKQYKSVLGSIKLSFVMSSCVLLKGFPLSFPLFCCLEIMIFHVFFSGGKPRGFRSKWKKNGLPTCFSDFSELWPPSFAQVNLFSVSLLRRFRPCACTSDALSCPPIPRTLHRIAYWPWIICPGLQDCFFCLCSKGGRLLFWWKFWVQRRNIMAWPKTCGVFGPNQFGICAKFIDGGDVSLDGRV